jgi:hypothetical protein
MSVLQSLRAFIASKDAKEAIIRNRLTSAKYDHADSFKN